MSSKQNVVVVGAGVVGLTTALTLLRRGNYNVTIVSKHMPGDYDIEYTSPWAGANWWPVSTAGTREQDWDKITFHELWKLAQNVPAAGIHVQNSFIYRRKIDQDTVITEWQETLLSSNPWFKDLVPDFRPLREDELPKMADSGTTFKSVCINVAIFMPYLVSLCLEHGVILKRVTLGHICEAADLHSSGKMADVVVNCTGLSARKLGGVMDENVIPARGQITLVRNEIPAMVSISGTDDGPDELVYLMMRAAGTSSSDASHSYIAYIIYRWRNRDWWQLSKG
ncbi:hypothetical protein BDD12DRAFT_867010 [Trichophaea hybrida]|nr:hypothetical protein BDD12DRAFT_867010 [Trichophaea hybrida]